MNRLLLKKIAGKILIQGANSQLPAPKWQAKGSFNLRFCLILGLLLPTLLRSEIRHLDLQQQYPVLQLENRVWLGTPTGLLQYNLEDDSFQRFNIPGKNSNPPIRQLHVFDDWLWCVLDSGLASLHLRLNEWLFYDANNGLPAGRVHGIDFSQDYVWIATDSGSARLDLLIEEWEHLKPAITPPVTAIRDLTHSAATIWLITANELLEYDPGYEKWRRLPIPEVQPLSLQRIFVAGPDIWLVSNRGLIRFNPTLYTRQEFFSSYLNSDNLLELMIEDDTIWAVTRAGLFYYQQTSGIWREFEGNPYLNSFQVQNAVVTPKNIWFLTDRGVLLWDRALKSWEILDYGTGLSVLNYRSGYSDGSLAFLFYADGLDYRANFQLPWRFYPTGRPSEDTRHQIQNFWRNFLDNKSGAFIPVGKYRWTWEGSRLSWIQDSQWRFSENGNSVSSISGQRLDVKNQLQLGNNRAITGFYNNIDDNETMYGLRFKSTGNDLVQELNWGDMRRNPGPIPFGESASVFGTSIWLQTGAKTSRFKRSRLSLKAQGGELRSRKMAEFHQGANENFRLSLRDLDYLKNQFYRIPGLDSLTQEDKLELWIDDLNPSTNTPNTLEGQTFDGIIGDFDALKATEDYYFYHQAHALRLLKYVRPEWTIVARVKNASGSLEFLVQYQNSIRTELKNIYYFNANQIIPYSLRVEMTDTKGVAVPLTQFRLDSDGDGEVDPSQIDYDLGLLIFPEPEPFPQDVYQPIEPRSHYRIQASFQTALALVQLQHVNLVRGSELLKLDGIIASPGNDYVLDYTTGTLLFVREGMVNVDTRIEIEYEYYLEAQDRIYSAEINWSPSDQFFWQSEWLGMFGTDQANASPDTGRHLISSFGEIRTSLAALDFRFIPGMVYDATVRQLSGRHFETLISSEKIRFQARYQNFAANYQNLYRPQSLFGAVHESWQFSGSTELRPDLRLQAQWQRRSGFADNGPESVPADQSGSVGFLFHRKDWPGWQLTLFHSKDQLAHALSEKYLIQNYWEHQLPRSWAQALFLQRLKMEIFFRTGHQSDSQIANSERQKFRQSYVRLNSSIREQIQFSLFYRRNDLASASADDDGRPLSRSERLLFDFSQEQWRWLQVNARVENVNNQNFYMTSASQSLNLRQFGQVNFRLSPGQIWSMLTPMTFEFNVNQAINGWGTGAGPVGHFTWQPVSMSYSGLKNLQRIRNYFVKNEFRPYAGWLIYSFLELSRQQNRWEASTRSLTSWRWNQKVDCKLGYQTHLIVQYRHFNQDLGFGRDNRSAEPSVWLEHRLNQNFHNTWNLLYRASRRGDQRIQTRSQNWELRYDLLWQKTHLLRLQRFEIRQSVFASHQRSLGYRPSRDYQLAANLALDLYPIQTMILRLRVDFLRFFDAIYPQNDYIDVLFNLKCSLRF